MNNVLGETLSSSDWKQVNVEHAQAEEVLLKWTLEVPEPVEGEGWLFDNLIISQHPVIDAQPRTIMALVGSPVLLSANVTSGQNASFSWSHNGEAATRFQ